MNFNKILPISFYGYGIAIFPVFLLLGPLVSEIFLIILILFFLFSAIFKIKDTKNYFTNKYTIFLALFYISTLFSTLLNFYNYNYSLSGIFYFRIILFALAIWFVLDRYNLFNKKIVFIYSIFFLSIIFDSLYQFYSGQNILGFEITNSRISSFFKDELILGGFLTRLIPIFLLHLIMTNVISEKRINIFFTVIISLICLIIYLSGERTSFFLLILFFTLIFFAVKNLRKLIILISFISIFLGLIIQYSNNSDTLNPGNRMFVKTYAQIIGKGDEKYQEYKKKVFNKVYIFSHDHHGHYALAWKIILDNPIFGVGVKGFRYLCRNKIYILENNDGCSTHPHNTYMQIFSSNGITGLFLIVLAFCYVSKEIIRIRRKINLKNNFNKFEVSRIILLSAIFTNLWPLIPSGNFFNNWLSMTYFYPLGYYLYLKHIDEKKIN